MVAQTLFHFHGGPYDGLSLDAEGLRRYCHACERRRKGCTRWFILMPPLAAWEAVVAGGIDDETTFWDTPPYEIVTHGEVMELHYCPRDEFRQAGKRFVRSFSCVEPFAEWGGALITSRLRPRDRHLFPALSRLGAVCSSSIRYVGISAMIACLAMSFVAASNSEPWTIGQSPDLAQILSRLRHAIAPSPRWSKPVE